MTNGTMPKHCVFRENQQHARFGRHARKWRAGKVDVIHHPAQVFAGDGEDGMRCVGARADLVIGHDAVHQHFGTAIHSHNDDHPNEWNRQRRWIAEKWFVAASDC